MYFADPSMPMHGRTFSASSENPTAAKGGGSRGSDIEKTFPCTFIQPGETLTILDIDGPGYIGQIWTGGNTGWHMIIRMYWDNSDVPSVEAPLSAFFGHAYYNNCKDFKGDYPTLNSALLLAAPCRGFSSYFKMPFKKHAKITVENRNPKQAQNIYYTINGQLCDVPEDTLYFHASYRQAQPLEAGKAYTVIDGIEGSGNFLGVTLSAGINGRNGCWVEGEVKMFVDDDIYPSLNYTGTEDYFCGSYAFGYDMFGKYQPYSGLYAGMNAMIGGEIWDRSISSYNTQPRFMGYRWHLPDPVHFDKNFSMKLLNMGYMNDKTYGRRDDFASVAYWYQTLPHKKFKELPSDDELSLE